MVLNFELFKRQFRSQRHDSQYYRLVHHFTDYKCGYTYWKSCSK